ncbi:hypothetical protein RF11_11112 [Thelohanellus kitauei]|uniref:Uncharacterized protein n=1 Tax=Thelohanellus kitauei TaxID=669202 RepID=A0A0C2MQC8_THEKT|nr:hypothetical protein RF11_11112 [Thelohanellus kitauei]
MEATEDEVYFYEILPLKKRIRNAIVNKAKKLKRLIIQRALLPISKLFRRSKRDYTQTHRYSEKERAILEADFVYYLYTYPPIISYSEPSSTNASFAEPYTDGSMVYAYTHESYVKLPSTDVSFVEPSSTDVSFMEPYFTYVSFVKPSSKYVSFVKPSSKYVSIVEPSSTDVSFVVIDILIIVLLLKFSKPNSTAKLYSKTS